MRIGIALDRSKRAEAALERAAELARAGDGELVLINVFSPAVDTGHAPAPTPEERRALVVEERTRYLEEIARSLHQSRVRFVVEAQHKAEDPDRCIARVAAREGVDVLAVTSKHSSGIAGLILGSTAQGLLRSSPCPVLVVRPEHALDTVPPR